LQELFDYRTLVSGQAPGLRAAAARGLLRLAEVPYTLAVGVRNWRFDQGHAATFTAGVPVISVGNLTLGGTGKTPMVEWLARWLRDRGVRVALVSRGYGAKPGSRNDEALELEQKLPGVPHLQDPDRVAAAREAVERFNAHVVLLDDGFQHRRLRRDVDIVLLDALEPFGHGHVFPRGLLREPVSGLRRADVVCLSRADLIAPAEWQAIRREVERFAPHADWLEAAHAPHALRTAAGEELALGSLSGRRIAAFCGLGNPKGFRRTLEKLNYAVAAFHEFPDHHAYTDEDLRHLAGSVQRHRTEALVCTHKDLVKISAADLGGVPLLAVVIGMEFLAGRELLEERLSFVVGTH
jgi:tetraacyldisaccharide 4'-kinase